jgi:hypothetical protein
VENPARDWRASFRNRRAVTGVTDNQHGRGSARRRKPPARQSRAGFSTGGSRRESQQK